MSSNAPEPYYSHGLRARFQIDGIRAEQQAKEEPGKYADIQYEIDEQKYRARAAARVAAGGLPTSVPAGWPSKLEGPLVWSSDSFQSEKEYVYELTVDDKAELLDALVQYKRKYLHNQPASQDHKPS